MTEHVDGNHPRARSTVAVSDRLATLVISRLMLLHIGLVAVAILIANAYWLGAANQSLWDDRDVRIIAGGLVASVAALLVVRAGRLRLGVGLYLAVSAAVALVAPFVPEPHAEIGVLAWAMVPVIVASVLFSARTTLLILAAEVLVAGAQLAMADTLTAAEQGTGRVLLFVVATTGVLIVMASRHTRRLEREGLERYHLLFEAITDGIFVVDDTGRILDVNEAACRQLGYSRAELLQLHVGDIAQPVNGGFDAVKAVIAVKRATVIESRHRRKDGTLVPVEVALSRFDRHGTVGVLGIARDVTARRRAELERARLTHPAQEAMTMESVGRLAGGVAHDFNNLLTVIIGATEMAIDEATEPSLRRLLEDARSASHRAAALTRQLLAFSRRQVMELRPVDLNALIDSARPTLCPGVGDEISVRTDQDPDLWPVTADPAVLQQTIVSLVANACDAMPGGGRLTIETRNVVFAPTNLPAGSDLSSGDHVVLSVSDTGVGITSEVRSRLFEPFFTTKPKGQGLGLGLATVWGAIKQSGGHVEVDSQPGQGATFRLYLPRARGEMLPVAASLAGRAEHPASETILLVEDEELVRATVARQLDRLGYRVLEAADGQTALALAREVACIDLLLSDVVMPAMNGRELASLFLTLHPAAPVLFISGYTGDEIVSHHGELDPQTDLLAKPFSVGELSRRVRAAIDRGRDRVAG